MRRASRAAIPQAGPRYMIIGRAILIGALNVVMSWGLDKFGGEHLFDYWTVFIFTACGFWLGSTHERDGRSE
jgi:hypothetical protein